MAFQLCRLVLAFWSLTVPPYISSTPLLGPCTAKVRTVWYSHWVFIRQDIPFSQVLVLAKFNRLR
ncbi:hypothetical protein A0J61_00549 [Choanephora cucurbitarum]|uniref:Secreted protein n=1 Tax=Choanephora cucurbitarum TaxID=101091 RepID=A0A1C7NR22_9FUNG|nr:hypothetical protein A0J61_00549 [Choanephora cucurbitarum]